LKATGSSVFHSEAKLPSGEESFPCIFESGMARSSLFFTRPTDPGVVSFWEMFNRKKIWPPCLKQTWPHFDTTFPSFFLVLHSVHCATGKTISEIGTIRTKSKKNTTSKVSPDLSAHFPFI